MGVLWALAVGTCCGRLLWACCGRAVGTCCGRAVGVLWACCGRAVGVTGQKDTFVCYSEVMRRGVFCLQLVGATKHAVFAQSLSTKGSEPIIKKRKPPVASSAPDELP